MRRKRWLAFMMTVTMGVGLLAGCGSDAADSKGQAPGKLCGSGGRKCAADQYHGN